MMRLKILAPIVFTLACTTETASRADSAAAPAESVSTDIGAVDSTMAPTPAPAESAASLSPGTDPGTWKVNMRGIGPLSAGMTIAEANAALGNRLVVPAKLEECDYVRIKDGPPNLLIMVERGSISRIEVARDSRITTEAGAKIGDTEAQIKSMYPGVETQPHKYTDGHYLVVTPSATADQAYRLVFETDGQKVLRYRSGRMPAVQYVESCS